mmetsp:Transcript_8622/g.12727  ORF Transcript_8622/g.12727 Transcript_8622/m.12727 type:complete len:520 (-) Transcript_8622:93-1652(-)
MGLSLTIHSETDGIQNLLNLITVNAQSLNLLVNHDVLHARQVRLLTLNISLDEDSLDLSGIGKTLNLIVGDGPHQSSLSRIVTSQKTVTLTTLQTHLGVVQQNLGTVRKSELTVTQLFRIFIFILLLRDFHHLLSLDTDGFHTRLRLSSIHKSCEVRNNVLLPLNILHESKIHHTGSNDGSMGDDKGIDIITEGLGELLSQLAGISTNIDGLVTEALKTLKLFHGILGHTTSLGVRDGAGILLQLRQQQWQERSRIQRIVDQLGHVVDNHGRLTLGGGGLFAQTAQQQGHNHRQSGRFDALHKGNSSHFMHNLRHLLGLGNGNQNLVRHVVNILVSNDIARSLHRVGGSSLDLLLGVPHARGNFGHDFGQSISELLRCSLVEDRDAVQSCTAYLPILLYGKLSEYGRHDGFDREGGHILTNGLAGLSRQSPHRGRFAACLLQCSSQTFLGVGLSSGAVFCQGFDHCETGEGLGFLLGCGLGDERRKTRAQSRGFDALRFDFFDEGRGVVYAEVGECFFQ